MQLSVNLDRVSDINEIRFRFFQNALVQNLFEFENGTEMNVFATDTLDTDHVQLVNNETGSVRATILLVNLPNAGEYPIEIDMTLSVLIYYASSLVNSTIAKAVGSVVLAPGKYHTCTWQ